MAPAVGLEPTTDRLTADCSTTELRWNSGHLSTPKKNKNQVFFSIDSIFFGGRYRNRTSIKGFAVLCISHSANRPFQKQNSFTHFLRYSQEKKRITLEIFFLIGYSLLKDFRKRDYK